MITLLIPSQGLIIPSLGISVFQAETTIELRDPSPHQPGAEIAWLLVPVPVAQSTAAKQQAIQATTRIDFAPTRIAGRSRDDFPQALPGPCAGFRTVEAHS